MRDVVLLGSTGSIGTQAIEVIARNPDRFRVTGLAAGGDNIDLLARQVIELETVQTVAVAKASAVQDLQLAIYAHAQRQGYAAGQARVPKILAGPEAAAELAGGPADLVLNGIDGSRGLPATLAALAGGNRVALANKESLVAGGSLVRALAGPDQLVPVDSEHTALAQCLRGGHSAAEVRRLIVTASGGPFRGKRRADLADVTVEQAMAHPTWEMGRVITINSATMVNKGLEVIEGHELFQIPYDRIDVVVQPDSIVHGMVEFTDGSTVLQASPPDMRLTISLALAWPERVPDTAAPCDWTRPVTWAFEPLDSETFPAVELAKAAGREGGTAPAVYNAANEVAVEAFCAGRLPFLGIVDTVERVLDDHLPAGNVDHLQDVISAERWARTRTAELVKSIRPR